ncbi:MAG TPA: hypothetical protein PLR99_02770 [Polyangiaceae bacterium]|nr:hypothetical protein [Polyangiaceae bacterium]
MWVRGELERAVDLHRRGYALLRWLEEAFQKGFIAPEAAHGYATVEASAYAWLEQHYDNLPAAARPAREDLGAFSRFFTTYLVASFDLELRPGEQLYSPRAHCFCPQCSWLVRAPHWRPKKVGTSDKRAAERLRRAFVQRLAGARGGPVDEAHVVALLREPGLREAISLCAYASDLLSRLDGHAEGAASLALWRSFAWTPEGSPRRGFVLTAGAILEAEAALVAALARLAQNTPPTPPP